MSCEIISTETCHYFITKCTMREVALGGLSLQSDPWKDATQQIEELNLMFIGPCIIVIFEE